MSPRQDDTKSAPSRHRFALDPHAVIMDLIFFKQACLDCSRSFLSFLCDFQVGHQLGRPLTASAAARARRVRERVRVARPLTNSPLPVPRPSQKPAPLRRQ